MFLIAPTSGLELTAAANSGDGNTVFDQSKFKRRAATGRSHAIERAIRSRVQTAKSDAPWAANVHAYLIESVHEIDAVMSAFMEASNDDAARERPCDADAGWRAC